MECYAIPLLTVIFFFYFRRLYEIKNFKHKFSTKLTRQKFTEDI